MSKTTKKVSVSTVQGTAADASKGGVKPSILSRFAAQWQQTVAAILFVVLWAFLAFYESALLQRTESLSLFVYDTTFLNSILLVPAGMLSLLGSFLIQFFYYPALGAAIYVLLLYVVYRLVHKVFDVPSQYSLLALLPVVALLASNTQLGYWLFYLKMPGYYYMALLATLFSLLAMWAYKGLGCVSRAVLLCVWIIAGYPLMGVYALVSALLMVLYGITLAVQRKEKLLFPISLSVAVLLLVYFVPRFYYSHCYCSIALEEIYMAGTPVAQWNPEVVANVEYPVSYFWHNIRIFWMPFVLLLAFLLGFVLSPLYRDRLSAKVARVALYVIIPLAVLFMMRFWFWDNNFRTENKQNVAIWEEDWRAVADYAKKCDEPTRQIILNKNIALLKLGRAGNEMFTYPDGGALPLSPMAVHMTHTDGNIVYYHFGRFNYCYRWCMENAVEQGWRNEYLKSAARSMLLSGEYKLAGRYLKILKSTMFHRGWAQEMEKYIEDPTLIEKNPAFAMPLQFACYSDALSVDDVVEKYMMDAIDAVGVKEYSGGKYMHSLYDALSDADSDALGSALDDKRELTPEFVDASVAMALVKKDAKRFWSVLNLFINNHIRGADLKNLKTIKPLPRHYQEAVLLFMTLDKGKTVQIDDQFLNIFVSRAPGGVESNFQRFQNSVAKTREELRSVYPQITEDRLNAVIAALLKKDFGNTYYYYYFFVKKIMTY